MNDYFAPTSVPHRNTFQDPVQRVGGGEKDIRLSMTPTKRRAAAPRFLGPVASLTTLMVWQISSIRDDTDETGFFFQVATTKKIRGSSSTNKTSVITTFPIVYSHSDIREESSRIMSS